MGKTCRQVTTFPVNGKAVTEEYVLPVTPEADEARHLESGVVNLYPQITYQEIEGFGGAMTESSAYLFSCMTPEVRRKALAKFFGKDGSQFCLIRTHMDSCDFALGQYQAVEDPLADPDLNTFSIDRDRKYIIPMIKEVLAMRAEEGGAPISVLLSPWSPPKQWKTPPEKPSNDAAVYGGAQFGMQVDYEHPGRYNGGSLKPEYYGPWAEYLTKYVLAYLDEQIPVTMMTMQNESIAATTWDSCVWTAADQKVFLKDYLYPAFEKAGLAGRVGIFIWDHNKERVLEWSQAMIDDETKDMISGIAFHWYSGDHFEAVKMTADAFPGMTLMLSECCVMHAPGMGSMLEAFGFPREKAAARVDLEDAQAYAHDIIGNLNAGMQRWIDWNLCLDTKGGPRTIRMGCGAPMIADGDAFYTTLTYDYVGHFSRYIKPGAKRIGMSLPDTKTEGTAAINPDGSVVLVLQNRGGADAFYAIRMQDQITRFDVPAGTITTLVIG